MEFRVFPKARSPLKREKYFVFERNCDAAYPVVKARVEVDLKFVQSNDFPKMANKLNKFMASDKEAYVRFEDADMCVVAEIRGDIVALNWVVFSDTYMYEIERKIQLRSGSAYVFGIFIVPNYRGLGIYQYISAATCSYLRERGFRKVYNLIRHDNFRSLKASHKVGYQKIGTVRFIRIWRLGLYRFGSKTKKDYTVLKSMFSLGRLFP